MITLDHVTKTYQHVPVLTDVSLALDEPGIYCLLGRNGAGKTTLLKSVAGFQNVTSGSVTVEGRPVSTASLHTGVSYVENFARHFNLPVRTLLRLAGELDPAFDHGFAAEMLERFELDGAKKFSRLSLGMKTMVSTILCLASNRPAVLLDEPVLGFDALMRAEFYELLTESAARSPRVILVSTHIIDEIERVAQRLIVLDRGRVRFYDTLDAMRAKAWRVSGTAALVDKATQGRVSVGEKRVGGLVTRFLFDAAPEPAEGLEVAPLSLQDFFLSMVETKGGRTA